MRGFRIMATVAVLTTLAATAVASVLATPGDIARGRRNLADERFADVRGLDTGIGSAVRYRITGDRAQGDIAKVAMLRAALEARETLPNARGTLGDVSSRKLYEALVIYDLITGDGLIDDTEREGFRTSIASVLDAYLAPSLMDWSSDDWNLGAAPLRIVASCTLYAFSFSDDRTADRFLNHAIKYYRANLANGVGPLGAWLPDNPDSFGEVLEYAILTARALRNQGFQNHFDDPRFRDLVTFSLDLISPQPGDTTGVTGVLQAADGAPGTAVMAAGDLLRSFPTDAGNLVWNWTRSGYPLSPLGLLFIDTAVPVRQPNLVSTPVGGGIAVLRDRSGTGMASEVVLKYGGLRGMSDPERNAQSGAGDFSFFWSGHPVVYGQELTGDDRADRLTSRRAWRHNMVTWQGAGEGPLVPADHGFTAVDIDATGRIPGDFYSDGLNQFLSTDLIDYAVGETTLPLVDRPASRHYRHALFLKPDALLLWDQIESGDLLEWNLWTPAGNVREERNLLRIPVSEDLELHLQIVGEGRLDYRVDSPPSEWTRDWPFIMTAPSGAGRVTVVTADPLFGPVPGTGDLLLENLVARDRGDGVVGVIAETEMLEQRLAARGIPVRRMTVTSLADTTEMPAMLIVEEPRSAEAAQLIADGIGALDGYVARGGRLLWLGHNGAASRAGGLAGPATFPVALDPDGCAVVPATDGGADSRIVLNDDTLWTMPNIITREMFSGWLTGAGQEPASVRVFPTLHLPAAWSDEWTPLAAYRTTLPSIVPVTVPGDSLARAMSRLRINHPASQDYFTLLLPRETDSPFRFTVTRDEPGYVEVADPINTWEVGRGANAWTDANLSVRVLRDGGVVALYAFDCTRVVVDSVTVTGDRPFSIFWDARTDSGRILAAQGGLLAYPRGAVRLQAGEVGFRNLLGNLMVTRESFVSHIRVLDIAGSPVAWADVMVDGNFSGATDDSGRATIRWGDHQPEITVTHSVAGRYTGMLAPGDSQIILDPGRP